MCEESDGRIHSGCTAVTAFLRIEDADGIQSFLNSSSIAEAESPQSGNSVEAEDTAGTSSTESVGTGSGEEKKQSTPKKKKKSLSGGRIKKALKSFGSPKTPRSLSPAASGVKHNASGVSITTPPSTARRVLYSANAGDARGVLCRAGKAVRLTYDHKGSDKQEAKRITDAGGFVMSGRVNGVLAVTRSLGDSSMKEFVVGAPYTTETELCDEDEFLILACDGVSYIPFLKFILQVFILLSKLWDVVSDQGAIELVREIQDAQQATQKLLKHALQHHTTDNVTVLVVRFKNTVPRTA